MGAKEIYLRTLITYISEQYSDDEVIELLLKKINDNEYELVSSEDKRHTSTKVNLKETLKNSVEILKVLEKRDQEEIEKKDQEKISLRKKEEMIDIISEPLDNLDEKVEKFKLTLTEDQLKTFLSLSPIAHIEDLDLNVIKDNALNK